MVNLTINYSQNSFFEFDKPTPSAPPLYELTSKMPVSPPSYREALKLPSLGTKETKTDLATRNWEEKSKLCKRDHRIQKITLVALIALGIVMAAAGVALAATGVGLVPGIVLAALGAFHLAAAYQYKLAIFPEVLIDYSNPKKAQKVIDSLQCFDQSKKNIFSLNLYDLERYGFINKEQKIEISTKINEYKEALKKEGCPDCTSPACSSTEILINLKRYIDEEVAPYLPSPI